MSDKDVKLEFKDDDERLRYMTEAVREFAGHLFAESFRSSLTMSKLGISRASLLEHQILSDDLIPMIKSGINLKDR